MKKIVAIIACMGILSSITACTQKKEVKYAKEFTEVVAERGSWNDNTFEGNFSELSFNMASGWEQIDEDTLASLSQDGKGITYDMMCQNLSTGSTVSILYENLLESMGSYAITSEQYINSVETNLYNMGMEILKNGKEKIDGKIFDMVLALGESEDFSVKQCSFATKKEGYMISVIVTVMGDDKYEDIMKCFEE